MVKYYKVIFFLNIMFVTATVINAQNIQGVSPTSANKGGLISVTISGQGTSFSQISGTSNIMLYQTGFTQGTPTISPVNLTINSETEVVADFRFPNCLPVGDYELGLYDGVNGFLTLAQALTVNNDPTPPSITSVSPSSASAGATLAVTISGQNTNFTQVTNTYQVLFHQISSTEFDQLWFEQSSSVMLDQIWFSQMSPTGFDQLWFGQSSSTAFFPNSVNVINDNTLEANITVPAEAPYGSYNVSIYDNYDCLVHKLGTYSISNVNDPNDPNYNPNNNTTELKESSAGGNLLVYPNPFIGTIYVEGQEEKNTEGEVKIIDSKGQIVFSQKMNTRLSRLEVPFLEPGIYNVLITQDGKQSSRKIVKQ